MPKIIKPVTPKEGSISSRDFGTASRLFDGTDDTMSLGPISNNSLNTLFDTSDTTFACWYYANSAGENGLGTFFDFEYTAADDGAQAMFRSIDGDTNMFQVSVGSSTTNGVFKSANNALPLNTWTHLAFTWSATNLNVSSFYINGVAQGSFTTNTAANNPNESDLNELTIGNNVPHDRCFDGYLADVRFYDAALGSTEIQFLSNGIGYLEDYQTNLVGWWFKNTDDLIDHSENTNDGITDGGSTFSTFSPLLPILVPNTVNAGQFNYDPTGAVTCGGSKYIRIENRESTAVNIYFYKEDDLANSAYKFYADGGEVLHVELQDSSDRIGSNRAGYLCCIPVAHTY